MAYEQIAREFLAYYHSKFDVSDGATRLTGLSPLYDVRRTYFAALLCLAFLFPPVALFYWRATI